MRFALVAVPALVLGLGVGYYLGAPQGPEAPAPEAAARDADLTEELQERIRGLELEKADLLKRIGELERRAAPAEAETAAETADPMAPAPRIGDEERERAKAELAGLEYHLSANPTDRDLLRRYIETAARAGEHDRSIAKLEELLKEHPDNPDLLTQLGRAYLMKTPTLDNRMAQGQLAFKALDMFTAAIEKDPDHFDSRMARAVTNYYMPVFLKRIDQSIADFEALVEAGGGQSGDDRYARAYSGLAAAYRKAGREEEAKKTIREGLALFPGDERLKRLAGE